MHDLRGQSPITKASELVNANSSWGDGRSGVGPVAILVLMLAMAPAAAEQRYKGDGTPGGTMPDLTQDWGQKVKGICAAAAAADALWFLDQHGFPGLVAHANAQTPNNPWCADAEKLVLNLADLIFGKKYLAGEPQFGQVSGLQRGIAAYIRDNPMKYHERSPNRASLAVRDYDRGLATYNTWLGLVQHEQNQAIGSFSWRNAQSNVIKYADSVGRMIEARHAMTAAGYDTTRATINVTMGWEDHPGNMPPYGLQPDANGKPFIDNYPIDILASGSFRIPGAGNQNLNLFKRVAGDRIALDTITAIVTQPMIQVQPQRAPGRRVGLSQYNYELQVDATNDFSVQQWFLEIGVPFDLADVEAPQGWSFVPWDPRTTPEFSPPPELMTAPDVPPDDGGDQYNPEFTGLLFYTTDPTRAVVPGSTLGGFAFAADDIYPYRGDGLYSGLSSALSQTFDPTYQGMVTEFTFTGGPTLVPEPASLLLILAGAPLLLSACRGVATSA